MNPEVDGQIREARTLLNAAWHASDDSRYDQLIAWAKEIIDPLVKVGEPEALWLRCSLGEEINEDDRRPGCLTQEDFERRYLEQLRETAKAGSIDAKFVFAHKLFEQERFEEAAELYREAAEAGHAYAQWCYGLDLIAGRGVTRDETLGLEFIRKAAEGKFEGAIQFMADAHRTGSSGFPIDDAEAARWHGMLRSDGLIRY